MTLDWYTSESADDLNHDQEVDLAKIGHPGGAEWASVSPERGQWSWEILDRWLYEDATTLAEGLVPTEADAKQAVENWVRSNEKVARIIEHDQFERTSVGMYLPREPEDGGAPGCCDLCGATIDGEPVILTKPMPARVACSECASLDAASHLNADGTRR